MNSIHIKDLKGAHIHFVGIGGISMSGLAEFLFRNGYKVTGSDVAESYITRDLESKGIPVTIGHKASNVEGADLVVYTAAIITNGQNPEMEQANKLNIPTMNRAVLLGQIMEGFPHAIAISGTHGKTTTTSMLSIIMDRANLDPTIFLGGKLDEIGGNVKIGNSPYFLAEACEFSGSFLEMHPYIAVILNIDNDHLDYFKDMEHLYQSFLNFANLVPMGGCVVGCADDPLVDKLLKEIKRDVVSYGIKEKADWMADEIKYDSMGCPSFHAVYKGHDMGWFTLRVPGKHNVYNALASIAVAWISGISREVIYQALASYKGTHRRFEIKGKVGGVTVIDDYGHHPAEIKATLAAAQNYPHNKLWCVFQPFTFSRTKLLFDEFVDAFDDADEVIITDIMGGREQDTGLIHAADLVEAIKAKGKSCRHLPTFDDVVNFLSSNTQFGDVVITTGCGNVYLAAEMLVERMKKDLQAVKSQI